MLRWPDKLYSDMNWFEKGMNETHWFIEKYVLAPYMFIVLIPVSIYYFITEGS